MEAPTVEMRSPEPSLGPPATDRADIVAQLARELEARRLRATGAGSLVDEPGRRPSRE